MLWSEGLCAYIVLGSAHISLHALYIYRFMLCAYIALCSEHIALYIYRCMLCTFMLCTFGSVRLALYRAVWFHRHSEAQGSEPYVFIGMPRLKTPYSVKLAPYSVKLASYSAKLAF